MANPTHEHYPQIEQFPIGKIEAIGQVDAELIGIVKREAPSAFLRPGTARSPIMCMVENRGTKEFVLTALESSDNAVADAYSGINIRVNGSAVAGVTVAPGGRAIFSVETAGEEYVRFETDITDAFGRLTLTYWHGRLERKERNKAL